MGTGQAHPVTTSLDETSLTEIAKLGAGGRFEPVRRRLRLRRGLAKWWPGGRSFLAAVLAGFVLWSAFAPLGWWPMAPIGAALLALAVRHRNWRAGVFVGFACGLALFVPLLAWLNVVTPLAWLVLAGVQSLYLAAMGGALAVVVGRLPGWPVWASCLWVGQELVRSRWPLGGFTWGRLAFSQPDTPFTGLASVGGAPLVTFAVALSGCLLAVATRSLVRGVRVARVGTARTGAPRRGARVAIAALFAAVAVPAAALAIPRPTAGDPLQVAVVQGNVPHPGTHFLGQAEQVLDNHLRETAKLSSAIAAGTLPKPQIVLWSENASDVDPLHEPSVKSAIQQAVDGVGVPVLVGSVVDVDANHVSNTGIVWNPQTGPAEQYAKRHLVPFGEYIPMRSFVSHLTGLTSLVPRNFVAGNRPGALDIGPTRIADVICFEVAFDNEVRAGVKGGGRLIVVQTNNATYMHTPLPQQQLAMSQLRAVEHGRAVVIAAISGISAVVAPDGHVVTRTAQMTPAIIDRSVPLRSALTIADHLGAWPEWALGILGVLAVFAAAALVPGRR